MANLTSATGEVTISAPNRQTIKDILYIFDECVDVIPNIKLILI